MTIQTTRHAGAGTAARAFVTLRCAGGHQEMHELLGGPESLQRGREDVFLLNAVEAGPLEGASLSLAAAGARLGLACREKGRREHTGHAKPRRRCDASEHVCDA